MLLTTTGHFIMQFSNCFVLVISHTIIMLTNSISQHCCCMLNMILWLRGTFSYVTLDFRRSSSITLTLQEIQLNHLHEGKKKILNFVLTNLVQPTFLSHTTHSAREIRDK